MNASIARVNSAAPSADFPTFPFMKLALELRHLVYGFIVAPSDGLTLRNKNELRHIHHSDNGYKLLLADTTILRVCKAVLAEAWPVFYAKNHFHYLIDTSQPGTPHKKYTRKKAFLDRHCINQSAEHVRHISIEVAVSYVATDPSLNRGEVEQILPKHLEVIAASYPQLRQLEIHLVSAPTNLRGTEKANKIPGSWQVAKQRSPDWRVPSGPTQNLEGATLSAIRKIKTQTSLSRFTVSALASEENVFIELCLPLASREHWTVSNHYRWAGFSQRMHLSITNHLKTLENRKEHAIQQWHWEAQLQPQ